MAETKIHPAQISGGPTAVPGTGQTPVLETQLGPHVRRQIHKPASPLSIERVRATPDVASGENFELSFAFKHSAVLPDRTLEHLTVMVQKYVLEDGDVLVTFTETVDFTVHDAFLPPEPQYVSGQIRCRTFNAYGDSRETWIRAFNQVRVVKSAGNVVAAQPYTITLRFSYRKPFVVETSE